tara:strand:- start:509 stop:1105 length:597 start_codon:yes stop_codon:yes gene_type:complete
MFKQSVNIVNFLELYNVLNEIKHIFTFNIVHFESSKNFIESSESKILEDKSSIIIINDINCDLTSNIFINKDIIIRLDELPIKIEKLIDQINTKLIQQKYNFQSKLSVKEYILNINSRAITKKDIQLKLTQREIDIILFLVGKKIPQSVATLQNEVWGYASDLETHTVETHVYRLRKKIKNTFNDEKFIVSHNDGYLI